MAYTVRATSQDYCHYIWCIIFCITLEAPQPVTLKFLGRELKLKKACGSVLDTDFYELCERVH